MRPKNIFKGLYCKRVIDRQRICYNLFNDEHRYEIGYIKKFERILWELRLKKNPNTWPYRYW